MNKEKQYIRIFGVTFGHIAFASFLISVVSGIFLAIPYDVSKPLESISKLLLVNENAKLIRSLHYWSAQFFLIFTVLHFWDHLRLSTEKNVKANVWLRLTITILITIYIMLSGFILKGDSESQLAHSIFSSLFNKIPIIGDSLAYFFLGTVENLQLIYVHHIATATVFLLLFIIEHAKTNFPQSRALSILIIPLIIFSLLLPPSLHDKSNLIVKGPWYLVGIQEIFHWLSYPSIFLIFILILLVIIYLLPFLNKEKSRLAKTFLFILFLFYSLLTIIGFYFRGENWKFMLPWEINVYENTFNDTISDFKNFFTTSNDVKINLVMGRYEGCLSCHNNTIGLSVSHNPNSIGCVSCHSGNPFTLNKNSAHSNMILIPGNLSSAKKSCGLSECHSAIVERVENSLMNSMSGIVNVNKFVFDESNSLDQLYRIDEVGNSPSETHLKNLCASCHLSNEKKELGPINQSSRGGGCNACHLNYSDDALEYLHNYKITKLQDEQNKIKQVLLNSDFGNVEFHPDIKLPSSNDYCFGCHSRSGRISTNYEGWHETQLSNLPEDKNYRMLNDGRIFIKKVPDIHFEKGMLCIDCHLSYEIMGDGKLYKHKEEQVSIKCNDCHLAGEPNTKTFDQLDYESKKIIELRKYDVQNKKFLITKKSNLPIINSYIEGNEAYLIKKQSNTTVKIKPPLTICINGKAHKDLSCSACHTAWSPQCIGCHTEFNRNGVGYDLLNNKEMKGEWIEHAKDFLAEYPSLGVKEIKNQDGSKERIIDNFIPGMIITIDKDKFSRSDEIIFKRFYAPSFSHTIRKESRSCESCHNNPVALGYGRGKLEYKIEGKKGRWIFTPHYALSKYDGLPLDAWIGFLGERSKNSTTRKNSRPFTIEEQKRILTIGACLTCHLSNSQLMKDALSDYDKVKRNITKKCILPDW
ncbi:MAG: multiheme c-type cytochrome [Melioribacter sp.]|uniref:multiheme c-type cytochrome n=1 Tax=Rosettibacter primus TaxID=3111523 RepID=UPI00247D0610|nr:multiheme c-type cytochrome [Melioribacter sp.]